LWVLLNRDLQQRMDALAVPAAQGVAPMRGMMNAAPGAGAGQALSPSQRWEELFQEKRGFAPKAMGEQVISDVCVAPLLLTTWSQSTVGGKNVYNYYTPNNYVCGCTATAGAQIMRFHSYPLMPVAVGNPYSCWVDGVPTYLTMKGESTP